MRRRAAWLFLCAACAPDAAPAPPDAVPPARGAAARPYALAPVVAREIAALEAEVAREPEASVAPAGEPLSLGETRELLGAVVGSTGKLRVAALEDLRVLGERVVPALRELLVAGDADDAQRAAAVEALGQIASPSAVEALLERLERPRRELDPQPWVRAHCAWRLPLARHDWARDRALLALKYETDYETVIWLARTLESTGSLAGVVGLDVIARGDQPERAAEATAVLQAWAEARGLADPTALLTAYRAGEFVAGDEATPPSARARLATWRRIQSLSEWQLRGVDDARFVLVQSGPSAVEALARALRDENRYVRVHSAQVLERMGPRARAAAGALIEALDERELAPQAARALAALGDPSARAALCGALDAARSFELRVAAARALGALGASGCEGALAPLLAPGTPPDLRAAAAAALLSARGFHEARAELAVLAEALAAGDSEARALEGGVERWLVRAGEPARATLERWRELAHEPAAARAELLRQLAK